MIARLQSGEKQCRDGGHAGGETYGRRRVFQRAESGFQRRDGWIRRARVGESLVNANRFLMVGGGLIDGGYDSAGRRIGHQATADGGGRKLLRRKSHRKLQSRIAQKQQDRLSS